MKVITFGRNDNNDVIINDQYVGRNHCQIVENDGKLLVVDLNATNGTFVNGKRITGQQPLSMSDEIRIGQTTLNWQTYFRQSPAPSPTPAPIPSPEPSSMGSNKQKTVVIISIALVLAIGGIIAYFLFQPSTKHASVLPHDMVAVMSVNPHVLQKQTGVTQNDLSRLMGKLEAEVFNNRVNLNSSGIKYSAPLYAFIENVDVRTENVSWGVVLPVSDQQQFRDFVLNVIERSAMTLRTSNNIQYISEDHVFVGFDQDKCLCYVSTGIDDYQLENRGLELLNQDVSASGKKSKLFSHLNNDPVSCVISAEECVRELNRIDDFRNTWSNLGLDVSNSYLTLRLVAQNNGLEMVANSIDNKSIVKNVLGEIKGIQLSKFPANDMLFAVMNANGSALLREILASLPAQIRADVLDVFDEGKRQTIDYERIINAINGDVYLSIPQINSNDIAFLAEMPSANELNNSVREIHEMFAYQNYRIFYNLFNQVERNDDFLCLKYNYTYRPTEQSSQMQYQSDIRGKYIYLSVNVNPLLKELEKENALKEVMPFIRCVKKVSTAATATELSLKLELTQTWQYMLNNF